MTFFEVDVVQAFGYIDESDAVVQRKRVIRLSETECGVPGGQHYQYGYLGYGAADSSQGWDRTVKRFLASEEYVMITFHSCLYRRLVGPRGLVIIAVVTDGFFVAATRDEPAQREQRRMKRALMSKWDMTLTEPAERILGMEITSGSNYIALSQRKELRKLRDRFFGVDEVVPKVFTAVHPQVISQTEHPHDLVPYTADELLAQRDGLEPLLPTEYRRQVGQIQYMRMTRNDIHVGLSELGEHSHKPEFIHPDAPKWTVAYLWTTRELELRFYRGQTLEGEQYPNPREPLQIQGWSDASWATVSGGYSRFGTMVVVKVSPDNQEKQAPTQARTIRERTLPSDSAQAAELVASAHLGEQIHVFRGIHEEMAGIEVTVTASMPLGAATHAATEAMQDNKTLLGVLKKENKNSRNFRRMARLIRYERGLEELGIKSSVLVPTEAQRADGMTKHYGQIAEQWRHVGQIQGEQPAIDAIRATVKERGRQRKGQGIPRRRVRQEGTADGYDADAETIANTKSNTGARKRGM